MKKRMSKAPSKAQQKANSAGKYLGSGGARNTAKAKLSRQQRNQSALKAAQRARKGK